MATSNFQIHAKSDVTLRKILRFTQMIFGAATNASPRINITELKPHIPLTRQIAETRCSIDSEYFYADFIGWRGDSGRYRTLEGIAILK